MSLQIWQKLFLGTVLTVALALAAMTLLMGRSFEQGFANYLAQWEQLEVDRLKGQLVDAYEAEGSWEFVSLPPPAQRQLLGFSLSPLQTSKKPKSPRRAPGPSSRVKDSQSSNFSDAELPPPRRHRPPPGRPGGPPPGGGRRSGGRQSSEGASKPEQLLNVAVRIALFDDNKVQLAGPPMGTVSVTQQPLVLEGRTIGYLSALPAPRLQRDVDLEFARQQSKRALLIGTMATLLAALVSLVLTRRLTAPLPRLAAGTRRVASGDYEARVDIRSGDELQDLAQDFNDMAQALSRQREQQQQWIAQTSHELRTPLAVLTGELHALADGVRPLDSAAVQSLEQETHRLSRLVEDLYLLSVSDVGGNLIHPVPLDLSALLNDFCANRPGVALQLDSSGASMIMGDAMRLHQVLENLWQNSQRYCTPPQQIRVSLGPTDEGLAITWEDSPPGVPDLDLSRLFDPLYRIEQSRARATGGAGLGLAIVRSIAQAHGGSVDAFASELGGLGIRLVLPAIAADPLQTL